MVSITPERETKMSELNFRDIAVSKTAHGTIVYAIIDLTTKDVVAVIHSNNGAYKCTMVDQCLTTQRQVLEYVRKANL